MTGPIPRPLPLADLLRNIGTHPGVVVAFSGGVDSSVVLAASLLALGRDRVLAFTADSPSLARAELEVCRRIAGNLGVRHEVVATHELEIEGYRANEGNRCYFCKGELYRVMARLPEVETGHVMLNGANADDLGDHRPGMRAARESGVRSPLLECGHDKEAVRTLARHLHLESWNKPSSPCLASRIPYHTPVDVPTLARIEAAESVLKSEGFLEVRVRHFGRLARLEVPPDQIRFLAEPVAFLRILEQLRRIGFDEVEVDPEGLVSGKMNRALALATPVGEP